VRLGTLLELSRPFTLIAPVVGAGSGAVTAACALGVPLPVRGVLLALASACCATGASNAWNQAFDAEIDRVNKPFRPIPSGRATERAAMRWGDALALAALLLGALVSVGFLVCVGVGVLGTWIYSAPPFRTKRLTWGALLTIAIPRGLLVPVAGWAVVGDPLVVEPWALGAVVGLFVFGAAATKDFADVVGDRAHGCRTLPVVWGERRAALFIAPFLWAPFVLYPLFASVGLLSAPRIGLAALALALSAFGLWTASLLLKDPSSLASEKNHPAWRNMYLLLQASHVGVMVVYLLA
jgi:4-hydroxybenzoate polyprenyltransferase